jgi:hypothetical protein
MPVPDTDEVRFSAIATEFQDSHPIRLSHYFKNNSVINTSHISSFPDKGNQFRLTLFRGKQRYNDVIETTTLYTDLQSLRTELSGFKFDEVDKIKSVLNSYGYRLIATPTYNAIAERLTYQDNTITVLGRFNRTYFDSTDALKLTNGFSNNTLNNHPYMCIAIFNDTSLVGIATMLFRDWENITTKRLKDFFYLTRASNNPHNLYTYVLNADGTEVFDVGGLTKWNFSSNQQAGSNGYYSISRFSADDGIWGFSIGRTVNGDYPGPSLKYYYNLSYGIENYNATDAQSYYMWNNIVNTTVYAGYVFVRTNAY